MNLIVAVDLQWGFGKDGNIPWHCKEDFKFFKEQTAGSVCVMGKNTYSELVKITNGKLLPGREVVVISSSNIESEVPVYSSLELFVEDYKDRNVYFCGGERLYNEGLKYTNTVYVTIMHGIYNCDRFFPSVQLMQDFYIKHHTQPKFSESLNKYFEFVKYERR